MRPPPRPAARRPARPTPRPPVPRRGWAVAAAAWGALFAVLLVLVAAEWGPLLSVDRDIASGLHRSAVAHDDWTRTNRVFSDWVWDPWTMRALLAAVAGWLLWRGRWPVALWLAATAAIGTALQQGFKAAVGRERPRWPDPVDSAHYAAFPSGHALTATLACGLLLWLLAVHPVRRLWRGLAAATAAVSVLGVGFTRVYLGVHWATDVLAGWLAGLALTAVAILLYPYAADPAPGPAPKAGAPVPDRATEHPTPRADRPHGA
ncbi:phosphatase PAP2 family protein [Streptomyces buecherae]|uniref:Phosphatase PAP2 family protein n=1 Tax=Streptomyces buecherae TaxID=2763006 RepID=A0A7H8NG95_9ACTN|nr:phosphatase PAP2 family protein [Streptomyces buecherae]